MKKVSNLLALVSMLLLMTAVAQAMPQLQDGYTAFYSATSGSSKWNCEIQITGKETLQGYSWAILHITNWFGDGSDTTQEMRTTGNTMFQYDPNQPKSAIPYSFPVFEELKAGKKWTYTDASGYSVTATVESVGPVKVPAGTYQGVYAVHYVAVDSTASPPATRYDLVQYWEPGVGLIEEVLNPPSAPTTWVLSSPPQVEPLVGTWTGNMEEISSNNVYALTVQLVFQQVANTPQAYAGSITFSDIGFGPLTVPLTAIRGPFDPTQLNITATYTNPSNHGYWNWTFLGQMRKQAGQWVVDLHGSDTNFMDTWVSLGLTKEP
jgi:hypothetical protein